MPDLHLCLPLTLNSSPERSEGKNKKKFWQIYNDKTGDVCPVRIFINLINTYHHVSSDDKVQR